ncbi:MAG: ThiF family adenylyltransferase [Flavobacteriaceae bacterium]|nr:ThiF family adenylyltransferase [Flavobacteriaceae bacterium]
MLHKLIDHSPDLKKLRDKGYEIKIEKNHVLITSVPYLNASRQVKLGTLVAVLTISGNRSGKPDNHVAYFKGEQPCNKDGSIITALVHGQNKIVLAGGIEVDRSFSNKPLTGYVDYYHKMTTYINIISNPAQSIDDTITAKTFRIVETIDDNSELRYPDTNSSRAGITYITDKLKNQKIGIIGVGGTGSYVLDFISKCPVKEIRIFDNDEFLLHNAFRAPGAPEENILKDTPKKTNYFQNIYSRMHRNIVVRNKYIIESNFNELQDLDFIFICIDRGNIKKSIIEYLGINKISFIDVGMGIELTHNNSLIGMLRTTTSINGGTDHIFNKGRISFADGGEDDEYNQNIQIAELNALNASLAVIKWKKICGFYHDAEQEKHSLFSIDDNTILNDDHDS